MLLYIHVPFCRAKCRYCAFESMPVGCPDSRLPRRIEEKYISGLMAEMRRMADFLEHPKIQTVFFGGGTPSLLSPEGIASVLNQAHRCFAMEDKVEITLEANPDSLGRANRAADFIAAGINRVSLGVQSLSNADLRCMGRIHTAEQACETLDILQKIGCPHVNADFIWGLPGQTPDNWLKMLKAAVNLPLDHLSAYGLSVEAGTPFASDASVIGALPEEEALEAMFFEGADLLNACGLKQYEISNYARAGGQCLHNLGYWHGEAYLGLGPGAVSCHMWGKNMVRRKNTPDFALWLESTERGKFCGEQDSLNSEICAEECLMLRLRLTEGLDIAEYTQKTGYDFWKQHRETVYMAEKNGLLHIEEHHIRLTLRGMLLSDSLFELFFENLSRTAKESV